MQTPNEKQLEDELFSRTLQVVRLREQLKELAQEKDEYIAELLLVIKQKNAMIDRMQIRIDQGAEL